jgi:hypothetical protein
MKVHHVVLGRVSLNGRNDFGAVTCLPWCLELVGTSTSVASQILRSTPMGANIVKFNGVVLSVVDDVTGDSETPVVTLSISMICRPSSRRCS